MVKRKFSEEKILDYISKKKLPVSVKFVLEYWDKKNWTTKEGHTVQSISVAVNVCNSIYVTRKRKELSSSNREAMKNGKVYITPYNIQLQSNEWKAYRKFILAVKGSSCEICGKKSNIQVHHKQYINGRKAWEYLPSEVMVLCASCHKRLHDIP